jgi:predicted acyltransferase
MGPSFDPIAMTPSSVAATAPPAAAEKATTRLVSLDAFRGATIALMVLVNNNGSGRDAYPQLEHAEWHGWTITDTVFPSFVWIVGVALTLSLSKRLAAGMSKSRLMAQVARRAAVLFVFGLAVYAYPHFDLGTQRILGVLQRIAICYLIASAIYLYTGVRGQILWIAGLFTAYWMLMTIVPVPGYGPGRLDVEGNFAHYIDRLVLGAHNYTNTKTWDPEGVVSTLPAIATALFGVLAGQILRQRRELPERLVRLFVTGSLLLVAGLICSAWLPINKKLWTDSFSLFMAGLDFIVFAIFTWFIDELGYRRQAVPLVVFGMNAIGVYMVSEGLAELLDALRVGPLSLQQHIYRSWFVPLASPANASLLYSLSFVAVVYLVAYFLYRRGWFLRV